MPRTGGVYAPPAGTKGTPNTTILSQPYNSLVDDLTADANAPRPITAGGTGATGAAGARAALGLEIGEDVQEQNPALQSIAELVTAADKMIYATASNVYATTPLTPFARSLLDDADAPAVRTTLGVEGLKDISFSGSIADLLGAAGMVVYFAQNAAPAGFLKANGSAVSRTTYAALFAAIGTTFGAGNGSSTFALPDLRGEFVRGWDNGRGVDAARAFGSAQADAFRTHTHAVDPPSTTTSSDTHSHSVDPPSTSTSSDTHSHSFPTSTNNSGTGPSVEAVSGSTGSSPTSSDTHSHTVNIAAFNSSSDSHNHTVDIASFNSAASGGTETRPRNVALLACIKY